MPQQLELLSTIHIMFPTKKTHSKNYLFKMQSNIKTILFIFGLFALLFSCARKSTVQMWTDSNGKEIPVNVQKNGDTTIFDLGTIIINSENFQEAEVEMDSIPPITGDEVTVGEQTWMTHNLNVKHFRNGDPIPNAQTHEEWAAACESKQPAWCYYNNDSLGHAVSGVLYNFYAVSDPRNLAPKGLRISTEDDWKTLLIVSGKNISEYHEEKSLYRWEMFPFFIRATDYQDVWQEKWAGGFRSELGYFHSIGNFGNWWAISEDPTSAPFFGIRYDYNVNDVTTGTPYKGNGYSVRCLREKETLTDVAEILGQNNNANTIQSATDKIDVQTVKNGSSDFTTDTNSTISREKSLPQLIFPMGIEGPIEYSCLSPKGSFLLLSANSGILQLWSLSSGKKLYDLQRPKNEGSLSFEPGSVAFSPDETKLLIVSDKDSVEIWNVHSGLKDLQFKRPQRQVTSGFYTPSGETIVLVQHNQVTFWDAMSGNLTHSIWTEAGEVSDVILNYDQSIMVSSGYKTAYVWNVSDRKKLHTLEGHRKEITDCVFSPDEKIVITTSEDSTARCWDVSTGKLIKVLSGHKSELLSAHFTNDGTRLVIFSKGEAYVWNIKEGNLEHTIGSCAPYNCESVCSSPDLSKVALITAVKNDIEIWDTKSGELIHLIQEQKWQDKPKELRFSPDGKSLMAIQHDNIKFWDVESGKSKLQITGHIEVATTIKNPNGNSAISFFDDRILTWNLYTGKRLSEVKITEKLCPTSLFSIDRSAILCRCYEDSIAQFVELSTGNIICQFIGHQKTITHMAFSTDGKKLITSAYDNTIRIWEASTGMLLKTLNQTGFSEYFNIISLSKTEEVLLTSTYAEGYDIKKEFQIWNLNSGEFLHSIKSTIDQSSLTFNEIAGHTLILANENKVELWHIETGTLTFSVDNFAGSKAKSPRPDLYSNPTCEDLITVSPDGKIFAVVCNVPNNDWTNIYRFKVYNTITKALLFEGDERLYINSLAFNSDGTKLLCTNDNGTQVWDIAKASRVFENEFSSPRSAIFSPDGQKLAFTYSKSVVLFDIISGDSLTEFAIEDGSLENSIFLSNTALISVSKNGDSYHWDITSRKLIGTLNNYAYKDIFFSKQSYKSDFFMSNDDGVTIIYDAKSMKFLYNHAYLDNGESLIYDNGFRFDCSDAALEYLNITCGTTEGNLNVIKERLSVPGLIEIIIAGQEDQLKEAFKPKNFLDICD